MFGCCESKSRAPAKTSSHGTARQEHGSCVLSSKDRTKAVGFGDTLVAIPSGTTLPQEHKAVFVVTASG